MIDLSLPMPLFITCAVLSATLTQRCVAAPKPPSRESTAELKRLNALLKRHCYRCHGDRRQKASLNLQERFREQPLVRSLRLWEQALEAVRGEAMPPSKRVRFSRRDRKELITLLEKELWEFDYSTVTDPGYEPLRRLTHTEYDNSMRDLLGVDLRRAEAFPLDLNANGGFTNSSQTLFFQPGLVLRYLEAAEQSLSASFQRGALGAKNTQEVEGFLESFMEQAFRRPP